jgi:hypothetical protein
LDELPLVMESDAYDRLYATQAHGLERVLRAGRIQRRGRAAVARR